MGEVESCERCARMKAWAEERAAEAKADVDEARMEARLAAESEAQFAEAMEVARTTLAALESQVRACLDAMPAAHRALAPEAGGPEDLRSSLAISMANLAAAWESATAEVARLREQVRALGGGV